MPHLVTHRDHRSHAAAATLAVQAREKAIRNRQRPDKAPAPVPQAGKSRPVAKLPCDPRDPRQLAPFPDLPTKSSSEGDFR